MFYRSNERGQELISEGAFDRWVRDNIGPREGENLGERCGNREPFLDFVFVTVKHTLKIGTSTRTLEIHGVVKIVVGNIPILRSALTRTNTILVKKPFEWIITLVVETLDLIPVN